SARTRCAAAQLRGRRGVPRRPFPPYFVTKRPPRRTRTLQRPQEVEDVLLLALGERVEHAHHAVRLARVAGGERPALVRVDGIQQVARAPVVQEVEALAHAPEGRRAELAAAR